MTVRELREALNKYPDNMEVLAKRTDFIKIALEEDVSHVRSVKGSTYTWFGVDIPCALLTDESDESED